MLAEDDEKKEQGKAYSATSRGGCVVCVAEQKSIEMTDGSSHRLSSLKIVMFGRLFRNPPFDTAIDDEGMTTTMMTLLMNKKMKNVKREKEESLPVLQPNVLHGCTISSSRRRRRPTGTR